MNCEKCGAEVVSDGFTTGYGVIKVDGVEQKHCYKCCADYDKDMMEKDGKICLYIKEESQQSCGIPARATISNWPGSLAFKGIFTKGKHNIGRTRRDVWFRDHMGRPWYGWNCGDHDIVRCRLVREKGFPLAKRK